MHLGHKNQLAKYTLYGRELEVTHAEKDLGVMMDEKMKFHTQTAAAVKKANQIPGLVKKTFASRDVKTVLVLYKAMVRPHLEYGNVIWGPFYLGDIKAIESIQRRATKLIIEIKDMSYEDRLRHLKLPSFNFRF